MSPKSLAHFLPFKGLRYNPTTHGEASANGLEMTATTAPPYDIISPEDQQTLYNQHDDNVIRLILNQKEATDNTEENVYSRARAFFQDWQQRNVLIPEKQAAFYAYTQTFTAPPNDPSAGKRIVRKGILGLLNVQPYENKVVFPHEKTLGGPKIDRFNLMSTTMGNLSPIFLIYDDPALAIEQASAFEGTDETVFATDFNNDTIHHHLTPITDPKRVQLIQNTINPKPLIIADGHHRYETTLNFKAAVREQLKAAGETVPEDGGLTTDYCMVFVSNISDGGLKVYPTHRLLKHFPEGMDQQTFQERLNTWFEPTAEPEQVLFHIQYADDAHPTPFALNKAAGLSGLPEVMQDLDVAILDYVVFQTLFNSTADALKANKTLWFARDDEETRGMLASGKAQVAFWMQTPSLKKLSEVVTQGLVMPQKSTYFFPKILSGLVFNSHSPFMDGGYTLDHMGQQVQPVPNNLMLKQLMPLP